MTGISSGWRAAVTERVVLVGFMCSGKSTVGRLLADSLGWEFIDFDDAIERAQDQKIADIFREQGEAAFRAMERKLTEELESRRQVVLAPGGGWVTQVDLTHRLQANGLTVWLRVQPHTVYERHRQQEGVERPLLDVENPLEAIESILATRIALYGQADALVDTDGRQPQDLAAEIAEMVDRERS